MNNNTTTARIRLLAAAATICGLFFATAACGNSPAPGTGNAGSAATPSHAAIPHNPSDYRGKQVPDSMP